MIDFKNGSFFKLSPVDNHTFEDILRPMFVPGESFIQSFKSIRDGVVFTTERIFAINIQGITGKKKDFTSLPYNKIQVFSVETAGVLDMDSELDLWFSGLGQVRFEFVSSAKVSEICRVISEKALGCGVMAVPKNTVPADPKPAHSEPVAEPATVKIDAPIKRVAKPSEKSPIRELDPILPRANTSKGPSAAAQEAPMDTALSLGTLLTGVPAAAAGLGFLAYGHTMEGISLFGVGIVLLLVSYFKQ